MPGDSPIIREIIGPWRKKAHNRFPTVYLCARDVLSGRSASRIVPYGISIAINLIFHAVAVAGGGYDCNWLARSSPLQPGCISWPENRNPVFGGPIIVKVVANQFLGHVLTVVLVLISRIKISRDSLITHSPILLYPSDNKL